LSVLARRTCWTGAGKTPENAQRVVHALKESGAAALDLTASDPTREDLVFQIGRPPSRIDILEARSEA
jgi:hypothetical protein